MKTTSIACLALAGLVALMPAVPDASIRGSQIVRPNQRPAATNPRPAPPPRHTDIVAEALEASDCVHAANQGAPGSAFEAKARDLSAAGIARGNLRRDKPAPGQDRFFFQVWEKYTLVSKGTCSDEVFVVRGPINDAWWANPRGGLDWGTPEEDTRELAGGGLAQRFLARVPGSATPGPALLIWSNETGAHSIEGKALVDRYLADGGPEGVGYPLNSTSRTGDGAYFNDFRRLQDGDTGTLYARPDQAAHRVMGEVHKFWVLAGREQSFLGWPRSSEMSAAAGQARQSFEGGVVLWDQAQGARVETPPYQLVFRGFSTLSQSNDQIPDPDAAEYTFWAGAVPRTGGETRHTRMPTHAAEYGSMRVGRWRSDEVVVYSGSADSLLLTLHGMERDSGSPDELLPVIRKATEEILKLAGNALGGLIAGPAGAAAGGELGGLPAEPLGKVIHESLDLGPEMLKPRYYVINLATLRQYRQTPASQQPTASGATAPWHFHVDLRNDEGDHARLFFEVVPGAERDWFGR